MRCIVRVPELDYTPHLPAAANRKRTLHDRRPGCGPHVMPTYHLAMEGDVADLLCLKQQPQSVNPIRTCIFVVSGFPSLLCVLRVRCAAHAPQQNHFSAIVLWDSSVGVLSRRAPVLYGSEAAPAPTSSHRSLHSAPRRLLRTTSVSLPLLPPERRGQVYQPRQSTFQ